MHEISHFFVVFKNPTPMPHPHNVLNADIDAENRLQYFFFTKNRTQRADVVFNLTAKKIAFFNFDIMIYIQSVCIFFPLWRFFLMQQQQSE